MVSDIQIKKIIIIVPREKKWKLLFSIDFRRCSTFVSCVQKHISNVIYHALCGKDYQQKSKHFFSSQMKFGEFGSIWLASDLFSFLWLDCPVQSTNGSFCIRVIVHAVRLLLKVQLQHAFQRNNYLWLFEKKSMQTADRCGDQQQRAFDWIFFLLSFIICYLSQKLCSYADWGVLIYNHVRVSLCYSLFSPIKCFRYNIVECLPVKCARFNRKL